MWWLAGELTCSTIVCQPCPSLERGKALGLVRGERNGDDAGNGIGHHQGDPHALDTHHVAEEVHKRHRADHIAKQARKRGDTHLLDRPGQQPG